MHIYQMLLAEKESSVSLLLLESAIENFLVWHTWRLENANICFDFTKASHFQENFLQNWKFVFIWFLCARAFHLNVYNENG